MNNDIVCELLEAKDDIRIKTDSEKDVTKDNEISDRLNRIESLILYLLKEKTEVSPIRAPNSTGAISTISDLSRSDTFSSSGFPFQVSRNTVPSMETSTAPKVSMGANSSTAPKSTEDPNSTLPGSVMTGSVSISTTLAPYSSSLELIFRDYKEITDTVSTSTTEESSKSTNSKEVNNSTVFSSEKSDNSQSEPPSFNSQLSVVERSPNYSMPLSEAL